MRPNGITVVRDETYFTKSYNRDKRLSLKAKGLLGLVLDLPPSWDFSIRGITSICAESKNTINAYTQELVKFGYCKIDKIREGGKFAGYHWTFYEASQDPDFTVSQKTVSQKTVSQKSGHNNKEVLKEGLKKGEGGDPANDPQNLPPPVLLWLKIMQTEITEAGARMIARRVSVMEAWEDTLEGWLASNWSKNNIDGQLNRYDKKVAEGNYRVAPKKAKPELSPEEKKQKEIEKRLIYGDKRN